jgi:hypothetical protein
MRWKERYPQNLPLTFEFHDCLYKISQPACTNVYYHCLSHDATLYRQAYSQHRGDVPDQFYDGGGESQAHQYVDGAHQHVRHLFFKPEKVQWVFIMKKISASNNLFTELKENPANRLHEKYVCLF